MTNLVLPDGYPVVADGIAFVVLWCATWGAVVLLAYQVTLAIHEMERP